jgi:hypothetical protein
MYFEIRRRLMTCLSVVCLLLVGTTAFSHHGRIGGIDSENPIELTGIVTEFTWRFPHCYILFDVADKDGNVVNWGGELSPPDRLSRDGMRRASLKVGDEVTITLMRANNGAPVGVIDRGKQGYVNGKPLPGTGRLEHEHALAMRARVKKEREPSGAANDE